MMCRYRKHALTLLPMLILLMQTTAEAQLFGERQMGRTLRRRGPQSAAVSAVTNTGTLRNQRFVRGNRGRSFVGRARTSFVGGQQATSATVSTTAVAPIAVSADGGVNRPYQPSGDNLPYDPPLTIGFRVPQLPATQVASQLARRLDQIPHPIEVSVEGRVATLRGVVSSEEERRSAELLVGFEPGISSVRNELLLARELEASQLPPQ